MMPARSTPTLLTTFIGLLALPAFATGCSASLAQASSGLVGCPTKEVVISEKKPGLTGGTWKATCRGREFYCSHVNTSLGSKYSSSQYQCTPAVPDATMPPPPPAAAPVMVATPAAAAPASASPSPLSTTDAPAKKDFPDKALGFAFASTPAEAQKACSTRGHSWQGSGDQYECSGAGVDVGVPVRTTLKYCDGGLCELRAFATLTAGAAGSEQLTKLQNALVTQYGRPDKERAEIPSDCKATLAACVNASKAWWSHTWEWSDGSLIRARLLAEDQSAILGVLYKRDQEAEAVQKATDSLNTDAF